MRTLLAASACLLLVVVLAVDMATAQSPGDCGSFNFHGKTLFPDTWRSPGTKHLEARLANNQTVASDWRLSICDMTGASFNGTNEKGYIAAQAPLGSNNTLVFNERLWRVDENASVVYHFASSFPNTVGNYVHVKISCCAQCEDMMLLTHTLSYLNHTIGTPKSTFTLQFGHKALCGPFPTTTALPTLPPPPTLPPMTTQQPTMTSLSPGTTAAPNPGTTTLPPPPPPTTASSCLPLMFNGREVRPNDWPAVASSALHVLGLNNSASYWAVSLCRPDMRFGQTGKRGFAVSQPLTVNNSVPARAYEMKLFREVVRNSAGYDEGIVFHYGTMDSDDFVHVQITCGPSEFLSFASFEVSYWNHSADGARTYTLRLQTADLCRPHTPAPVTNPDHSKCFPFQLTPYQTVDPRRFGLLHGSLLNVETGQRMVAHIDPCRIAPLPPPSGYVTFVGLKKGNGTDVAAFDLFERAAFFPTFGKDGEWLARYESSISKEALNDRAELRVRCGGTTERLSFASNFVFPLKNELGGLTYQLQLQTTLMCKQNPTMPPWLTTTATP